MSAEPTLLTKLSLKSMGATPAKHSLKEGETIVIAHIWGIASKHENVETNFGDSTRFVGQFAGLNMKGERFRSSKAFLPPVVEQMLADAIDAVPDSAAVEFAFEVGATYSEKGNTGYQYTVKPLTKLAENDALSALEQKVEQALKALPAPAKEHHEEKPAQNGKGKK
jgi:hypothetical protein